MSTFAGRPNELHPDVIARELGLTRMGRNKALSRDELLTRAVARFMKRVDTAGTCWTWQGERVTGEYGRLSVSGKRILAHRFSYEHFVAPIGPGLEVDHLCRNHSCVRPSHLEAVTREENMRRTRTATCKNGHPRRELPDGTRIKSCPPCRRKPPAPTRHCKATACGNQLASFNKSGWCKAHAWKQQAERKYALNPPTRGPYAQVRLNAAKGPTA